MSLNDFELGKILGKGSFASVLLVTRKQDRKIYAMKRINISKMDPKEKEGALNEIRILASLSHPNIIGYKEAFFDERSKTLNIVMEYADDGDIDKKIKDNLKKRNYFAEETIWTWIIQILEGLKYLHDNKIMHRDLKCANLFLMKNGLLKLGDLNVSKIAKLGIAQTQTGTPYYISPEIWDDQPYDYKCDIWSVGCIIYEMCTLRPPFRGTSLKDLYRNIKNGYYIPISNYYSRDIKDLVSMMLVVDYRKRASADELLNTNIVKNWIKKIKYDNSNNQLGQEIENNYSKNSKANLIQTIKIPKNLGEINKYLPKKRYNPSEEMMKNDKYEIMKETMKKGKINSNNKKMDLSWLNEDDNKNKKIKNNNNYYDKYYSIDNDNNNNYNNYKNNYNNNYSNNNNKYNNNYNNNRQHTPNIGKYNYLNRYDNNMRLIKKENENNYLNNNKYNQRNYYNNNYYNNKNNAENYKNKNNLDDNRNEDNNDYRYNYQNLDENYEGNREKRYRNDYIYNYRRNYENNNYQKNRYDEKSNYNRYNNNFIQNQYQNEEKNLTPNKYRYQNNERNYNNYYNNNYNNNRTPNKNDNNVNRYNDHNNYKYAQQNSNDNQFNEYRKQNININQNNRNINQNNNFNQRKKNRYKYIFTEEGEENNQDNNNDKIDKDYNYQQNNYNYNQNNHRNKIYRNEYNDRRDIGPRYNLYDFRYNDYNNNNNINNNKNRENDEIKIIYQKINYNNYCQQNNFDRKRNYHYYRENGYYNYNQAMENYNHNRYNNEDNYDNNDKYRKFY